MAAVMMVDGNRLNDRASNCSAVQYHHTPVDNHSVRSVLLKGLPLRPALVACER